MAGIFGVVGKEDCSKELFWGTHYLQHRAQDYCGLGWHDGEKQDDETHRGLMRQQFSGEKVRNMRVFMGIGSVAGERQPVSELSKAGGMLLAYDGNIANYVEFKDRLLKRGGSFSGYRNPEEVGGSVLISKTIAKEIDFSKGIERLVEEIEGDFAIVALKKEGIYAARGWGRKPLILGKKNGGYAVSSESNSFVNTEFEIVRDVEPGEIVIIDGSGIRTIAKLNLAPVKFGTFEWIYTAYPTSVIDGKNVAEVRREIGRALAKRYPVEADIVSPIPNSGRWHALGFSEESGIRYAEVFLRYDYSDRSYTPGTQQARDKEAQTKLIPLNEIIKGNRVVIVDDSIVRGTQLLNRVETLREMGAIEVHARIACPPLMCACKFGQTTKKDEDCIARRMAVEEIQEKLKLDSLCYATADDLEDAIGISKEQLCLECWNM